MAHADYNCCLICDRKMEYSHASETKKRPCEDCLMKMRDQGAVILNAKELAEFIERVGNDTALGWLNGMGYTPCYYDNDCDTMLKEKGLVLAGQDDGRWGNKLKPLP